MNQEIQSSKGDPIPLKFRVSHLGILGSFAIKSKLLYNFLKFLQCKSYLVFYVLSL
jgi:hypothetical protein